MSMIDRIIHAGVTLDWVTPLFGIVSQLRGHMVGLSVYRDDYPQWEAILKVNGIAPHYIQMRGDDAIFYVDTKQAQLTKDLLGIQGGWTMSKAALFLVVVFIVAVVAPELRSVLFVSGFCTLGGFMVGSQRKAKHDAELHANRAERSVSMRTMDLA
jgi:hypothetical protein